MPADANLTIWSAARQGDLESLQTMLADSPDAIHQQADDGCTALHYAAFGGSNEAVALLLEAGSDPNARAFAGHTPLHYAAFAGHSDVFRRLQAAGSDVHAVDDSLTTMLHGAAASGATDIVEALLAEGVPADIANLYGELPVHRAAQHNQLAIVQRLLDLGTDPNPIDRYGMSVLHKAAIGGAVETASWLLDKDFDSMAGDIVGDTPMHSAASIGRLPMAECLLDRDLSPDVRNHDEATPLHNAAIAGHADIVTLLLERSADASATDVLGRTPLHLAALRGHTDIVRSLAAIEETKAAADVNGHRPVELAAFYGRTAAWEMLASDQAKASSELTPATVKTIVGRSVPQGEMMAWYLGHSGWAVRTQRHLFIIDYAPGEPEREDASLINGRIDPAEWGNLTVFVIATHHHGDHFDLRILEWDHPSLRRVYGWDAPEEMAGFSSRESATSSLRPSRQQMQDPPSSSKSMVSASITLVIMPLAMYLSNPSSLRASTGSPISSHPFKPHSCRSLDADCPVQTHCEQAMPIPSRNSVQTLPCLCILDGPAISIASSSGGLANRT